MYNKIVRLSVFCVCVLFSCSWRAEACSTYTIQTNDGITTHTYWTRTMDLLIDSTKLGIGLRAIQQGEVITRIDSETVHASWPVKYTTVGAGLGVDTVNMLSDGVNSAGLSGGMFWLNSATYTTQNNKVGPDDFVTYVLTNYASVEEIAADAVKGNLNLGKGVLGVNSFHYTFTDKTGRTLVIEPIIKDGKFTMSMYTNYESAALNSAGLDPSKYKISINVMTNSPIYNEMIALYNSGTIEKTGTSGPARFYRLAENKQFAHDLESYAGVMMKIYTPFGMDSIDSHTEWNTRYNPIYDVKTDSATGAVKGVDIYIKPGDGALSTKYTMDAADPSSSKSLMRSFDVDNVGVDITDPDVSYWVIGDYRRGAYFNDGLSTPVNYSNQTTSSLANDPAYKAYIIHTNPTKEYGYSLGAVGYFRNSAPLTYDLTAGLISNNVSAMKEGFAFAGAIFNDGAKIKFSQNVFLNGNAARGMMSYGGAIFNNYYIVEPNETQGILTFEGSADFTKNKAGAATTYLVDPYPVFSALGGAIFNYAGKINFTQTANFDQNVAQGCFYATGGAISNSSINLLGKNLYRAVLNFDGDTSFTNNSAISLPYLNDPTKGIGSAHGGAIFNFNGVISFGKNADINVLFENNKVQGTENANGGAISNTEAGALVINGKGSFINNSATVLASYGVAYGGAIYNSASTTTLNARTGDIVFSGNKATTEGGAIFNANRGIINLNASAGNSIIFESSTDTLESAQVYSYKYKGDDKTYYSLSPSVSESDYVYVDIECKGKTRLATETLKGKETGYYIGTINVNRGTSGSVVLNGAKNTLGILNIRGGNMAINSPLTLINKVNLLNAKLTLNTLNVGVASVSNGVKGNGELVKSGNGILRLGGNSSAFVGDFYLKAGGVELLKGAQYFNAANTKIAGNTTFNTANGQLNNINFGNLTLNGTTRLGMDVNGEKFVSDTIAADSLNGNGRFLISGINYTKLPLARKGSVAVADDTLKGSVLLARELRKFEGPIFNYGLEYNAADGRLNYNATSFSSPIFVAPVAAQIGGYLTQINTYEQVFENRDIRPRLSEEQRDALNSGNESAAPGADAETATFSPRQDQGKYKALWVKPYARFENVGLRNGPNVDNTAYGALFGFDFPGIDFQNGWEAIFSVYAGYNGSHQSYDGVDIDQNGGTLGVAGYLYKGNFFTGLTADIGGNFVDADTKFGDENFEMFMTGIASKTGYNWELADGKFIIQPNFLMSYTFVNTSDYTNAAGVRIDSDPLHAFQLAPGVKFIGNLGDDWQPYASAQMVWNLGDKTKFTANDIVLPELAVKSYVQYGVGVQKRWGENITAYGQAMIRNGGVDGVGLQLGFSYAF